MTNLSNEHRLKQNIRISSINEFNRLIGGMNRSEILTFDEGFQNTIGLSEEEKSNINYDLVLKLPTLIKRPVLVQGENIMVGFSEKQYAKLIDRAI